MKLLTLSFIIACPLMLISTGFCLPLCQSGHGKPCYHDMGSMGDAKVMSETHLLKSGGTLHGVRAALGPRDGMLVRRSGNEAGSTPPGKDPIGSRYIAPTLEEAESVLSQKEFRRFKRLRKLNSATSSTRNNINKALKTSEGPEQELKTRLERLKPHAAAYSRLQREVWKRLLESGKAQPEKVKKASTAAEKNKKKWKASYGTMSATERIAYLDKQNERRARSRQALKTGLEKLRAKIEPGKATGKERQEFDELERRLQRETTGPPPGSKNGKLVRGQQGERGDVAEPQPKDASDQTPDSTPTRGDPKRTDESNGQPFQSSGKPWDEVGKHWQTVSSAAQDWFHDPPPVHHFLSLLGLSPSQTGSGGGVAF